jgi:hypothetical protein
MMATMEAAVTPEVTFAGDDTAAPIPCYTGPEAMFVAFLGQSNMVGFNMTPESAAVTGYKSDPLTFIWNNKTSAFEVLQPGVNTPGLPGSWGPEVSFAADFRAEHPDTPLYITKTSAGQTSLVQDLNANDDWNVHSTGEMFDKALARVDAASAVLGKRPDVVFISQGETDATDPAAAARYEQDFADFIGAVRHELMHNDNGYVAWTRIADSTTYWEQVRWAQLIEDQRTAGTDSFDTFDTSLYSRQSDGLHLDAMGLSQVGHQFYWLFDSQFPFA